MYDNLMSGVYSILEINVGIICVSMPAFRRFLAQLIPKCFGSTQNDSRPEDAVPNARYPSSSKPSRRKKSSMNASLFNTTIMKTVDLSQETEGKEEDEVGLVELGKDGKGAKIVTRSVEGSAMSLGESTADRDGPREQEQRNFYHG